MYILYHVVAALARSWQALHDQTRWDACPTQVVGNKFSKCNKQTQCHSVLLCVVEEIDMYYEP
jgi:hypothetical protein